MKQIVCDSCGKTASTGFVDGFESDWIRVDHNSYFSSWYNSPFPPSIRGDFCSLGCLLDKAHVALNKEEELIKKLGYPR